MLNRLRFTTKLCWATSKFNFVARETRNRPKNITACIHGWSRSFPIFSYYRQVNNLEIFSKRAPYYDGIKALAEPTRRYGYSRSITI